MTGKTETVKPAPARSLSAPTTAKVAAVVKRVLAAHRDQKRVSASKFSSAI